METKFVSYTLQYEAVWTDHDLHFDLIFTTARNRDRI